jgi:hypothetical protein
MILKLFLFELKTENLYVYAEGPKGYAFYYMIEWK